jgi:hypothetical protein
MAPAAIDAAARINSNAMRREAMPDEHYNS